MFIYDFSCLNLVSVPSTTHFLDCHLALEFCATYVGLITFGGICASPGLCSSATLRIYVLCKCVTPVIRAPRSEEACFVLNFIAILNLIWPGHPPFICACEQRFPMNILLHVHYAMHVLYSQPTRLRVLQNTFPTTLSKVIPL